MPKFDIFRENPARFREQILHFWEDYLPGTPAARLDWLEHNPAGPTIWLFAIEEKTGELAGTISLFPKDLFFGGQRRKAAILGDFMLHRKFRVFGPALSLLKTAREFKKQGNFDFLYTIPNAQSTKIIEKVGFRPAGRLYHLMNPQELGFLLEKFIGTNAARILGKPLLFPMKLFSLATYAAGSSGVFDEIDWHDESFNTYCQQVNKSRTGQMTGDYSLSYLYWRYRQSPERNFQVITLRSQAKGEIQGFFVVAKVNHRLELYDIVACDDKFFMMMIKKINDICKNEKCRGVYCSIYEYNPMLPYLRKCTFFDIKDQDIVYTYPDGIKETKNWFCTSADRNI